MRRLPDRLPGLSDGTIPNFIKEDIAMFMMIALAVISACAVGFSCFVNHVAHE